MYIYIYIFIYMTCPLIPQQSNSLRNHIFYFSIRGGNTDRAYLSKYLLSSDIPYPRKVLVIHHYCKPY